MDAGPPPSPPAYVTPVTSERVSQAVADKALASLSQTLPKTGFRKAWPAGLPGLVAVELSDGRTAYTDRTGRYLVIGLIFDTATGVALDRQMDGRTE